MDAKTYGAQPAYPVPNSANVNGQEGMTKRDMIAAQLMPAVVSAYIEANGRCFGTERVAYNSAVHAVRLADALLAELAKGERP